MEYFKGSTEENYGRAVDVLLVVDESEGMQAEHEWIPDMVQRLDAAFLNLGFGESSSIPNLFGLVGFGQRRTVNSLESLARTLTLGDGQTMYSSSEFVRVAALLKETGDFKDGIQAMEHALQKIPLRNSGSVEKIMILVTDGDRDFASDEAFEVTWSHLRDLFRLKRVSLHIICDESFVTADGSPALGATSYRWGFVRVGEDSVAPVPDIRLGASYRYKRRDYVHLFQALGGSIWDFRAIRMGGRETELFTQAFTQAVEAQTFQVSTQPTSTTSLFRTVHL